MSNVWFDEQRFPTTPAFEAWWLNFYGHPEDFVDTQDEQDGYWIRKAFAWHGWNAVKQGHG